MMASLGACRVEWASGCAGRCGVCSGRNFFHPLGTGLAVLDLDTGEQQLRESCGFGVDVLAASEDGCWVAYSENKHRPRVFVTNSATGELFAELPGPGKRVVRYSDIQFSGDGQRLLTVDDAPGRRLCLWDWQENTVVAETELPLSDSPYRARFRPDDWTQVLVFSDDHVLLASVESCHSLAFLVLSPVSFPVSASLPMLVSGSARRIGLEELLHLEGVLDDCTAPAVASAAWMGAWFCGCRGGELFRIDAATVSASMVWDDSRYGSGSAVSLTSVAHGCLLVAAEDGVLRWIQPSEGCVEKASASVDARLAGLCVSDKAIVAYGPGHVVEVQDRITRSVVHGHRAPILAAVAGTSGTSIITVSQDARVIAWDDQGKSLGDLQLPTSVTCACGEPGLGLLACGSPGGLVTLLRVPSEASGVLSVADRAWVAHGTVADCCFGNADGRLYVAIDASVVVCRTSGLVPVAVVCFPGTVCKVASLNTDTETLLLVAINSTTADSASGGDSATQTLWLAHVPRQLDPSDMAPNGLQLTDTATQLCTLEAPAASVAVTDDTAFAFCPASQTLVTVTNNFKQVSSRPWHQLPGDGDLTLSLDGQLSVTGGADGRMQFFRSDDLLNPAAMAVHSHRSGGCAFVVVGALCNRIIAVGVDGTLVSLAWAEPSNPAVESLMQGNQSRLNMLRSAALNVKFSPEPLDAEATAEKTALEVAIAGLQTQAEGSFDIQKGIKAKVASLREKVASMMAANETKPQDERLTTDEFTMDLEERQRMQDQTDAAVRDLQAELDTQILAQKYLRYKIKKECWDSMEVLEKTVCAFQTNLEVSSFSLRRQSREELKELQAVRFLQSVERAEAEALRKLTESDGRPNDADGSDRAGAFDAAVESATSGQEPGSDAPLESPDGDPESEAQAQPSGEPSGVNHDDVEDDEDDVGLYPPTALYTPQRKRNQIVLLNEVVHQHRVKFNKEFEEVLDLKRDEIRKVNEKNVRIMAIAAELCIEVAAVATKTHPLETPENLLKVDDSEVKVERVLTAEEQLAHEEAERAEAKRLEEQMKDNPRARGLQDMMHGRLEGAQEEDIWEDPPAPAFMAEVRKEAWSEEQVRAVAEYEAKMKGLLELRDKRRKALDAELRSVQEAVQATLDGFDRRLSQLAETKVSAERNILAAEITILKLNAALQTDADFEEALVDLEDFICRLQADKEASGTMVAAATALVAECQAEFNDVQAADRVLDKGFKSQKDLVAHEAFIDVLYKLFRRRAKKRSVDAGHDGDPHADIVCPEGLDSVTWHKFLKLREKKLASESQVKASSSALAHAKAFLQQWVDRQASISHSIDAACAEIERIEDARLRQSLNTVTVVQVKQGQAMLKNRDLIDVDFSDAVLVPAGNVLLFNEEIQGLARARIEHMKKQMDLRNSIHMLEWEHRRLDMEKQDLIDLYKETQLFRVSREMLRAEGKMSTSS
eukprot:m.387240 g.387240  ORF g.387240 m.387240 type:complete len:1455 (-) comp20062_c1_seq5:685-5049(-)